jgi:putative DNA primase/helicase
VARDALAALERAGITTDEARDKRRALQEIISAGDYAKAALAARKTVRRKYAISSGNTGKINGMLAQAAPHRTVTVDDLDADKLAFNVENGTLHFVCDEQPDPDASDHSTKTLKRWRVELRPHNHDDLISKIANVSYDTKAQCPIFDGMVKRFLPIDDVRAFVQRYHGYALTGLTDEQCLVFNYGGGANWKSTFLEYIFRIMGDYAMSIKFESLAGDNVMSGSQANPDIARLLNARLVRVSEIERGVGLKESLIKQLTGGEPMLARSLHKEFFEFRPDFKLVLSGNHKPDINGVDHGIWRRVRLVPGA